MDVTDEDGVRTVTLDRPEARNPLDADRARELAEAVAAVGPSSHDALLITGRGPAFSAGGDVQAMADREGDAPADYEHVRSSFARLAETLFEAELPVVARVNGDAVGAGLSLVALSDLAYAARSARLSCAYVHAGLIPDAGASVLLSHLVGLRTAKRLAFTGEFVDAEAAADLGLVTEAVDDDELDDRVDDVLRRLRSAPTATIGRTRRAIHRNLGREWPAALDYESNVQVQAYGSADHEEGVAAFLEDRDPEWE